MMSICKVFLDGDPEPLYIALAADILVTELIEGSEREPDRTFAVLPLFDPLSPTRSAYVRPHRIAAIVPTTNEEREQIMEAAEA